jgi:hypothetical protein
MLSGLKKANEILMKELNDYHLREKAMQKKEADLENILLENEAMKKELDELRL